MKIKVSIVENDKNYLERILDGFAGRYTDKLEVYAYSTLEQLKNDEKVVADIYLISDSYSFEKKTFPEHSEVVYFVDSTEIDTLRGQKTIAKYQKLEDIYKQISALYTEISGIEIREKHGDNNMHIYLFTSGMGGVGKSVLAVSAAHSLAMKGKKVLYLPFELFGNSDVYFERCKTGDLGNIIYAIKSKKSNISLKLSSIIENDFAGVSYISSPENSYDIGSMTKEDIDVLIKEICALGQYEYIIVDADAGMGQMLGELSSIASRIIYVTEKTNVALKKEKNYVKTMKLLENRNSYTIVPKMIAIVNKASKGQNDRPSDMELSCVGFIENIMADEKQIIEMLANNAVLQKALV